MKHTYMPIVLGLNAEPLCPEDSLVIEVFIAKETYEGHPVLERDLDHWKNAVTGILCDAAGGATSFQAQGHWRNPDTKQVQSEPVTVIRSNISREALLECLPKLRQTLIQYGRECEQHTVAFTLNGELFGIDPLKGY